MIILVNDANIFIDLLEIATKEQARKKLCYLMTKNSRLPAAECNKRLKRWKQG
jgi:hypothetical protein